MKQIVWISEACKEYSDEELLQLLNKSRANNVRRNVTGLLIYDKKSFMQFMEGDAESVDDIFQNRIEPSHLHKNVTLLSQREIEERNFKNWTMGFYSIYSKELQSVPGFQDFKRNYSSFQELHGDDKTVRKIIDGFQEGRWHLGQPETNPNPVIR